MEGSDTSIPHPMSDLHIPNDYKKDGTSIIMSSGITIEEVYQEIKKIRADMVKREDLEALVDTVEILSNPATMETIKKSDRDIKLGRVKTITSIDDLLGESV
jgi:formylmethanofuran dehydrogenase subunit E-like metal-binding protein